jgi:protein TonB
MEGYMKVLLALALVAFAGVQDSPAIHSSDEPGITMPRATRQVKADYTEEARANRIEGSVILSVVVLETGAIGEVTVTQSLDSVHGLDRNAVAAMKQWVFEPAKKDGKAVAVRIHTELTFTLK